ncbi:hypothetical protein MKW98_000858 [Papaver atlanticum]|uniref:Uncharacterized protein n=1 Tax=Papaver atlanticum TaxID=357466 RepID=A0AAD4XBN0_9MAGN|nr:hypothetical protein MKW98_000858 [Papaver atlanticum]
MVRKEEMMMDLGNTLSNQMTRDLIGQMCFTRSVGQCSSPFAEAIFIFELPIPVRHSKARQSAVVKDKKQQKDT